MNGEAENIMSQIMIPLKYIVFPYLCMMVTTTFFGLLIRWNKGHGIKIKDVGNQFIESFSWPTLVGEITLIGKRKGYSNGKAD